MIIYKGIDEYFQDSTGAAAFCKKHGIVYFKPSVKRAKWLRNWLKTTKLPVIETAKDIDCWFRSYGTWGMYHPNDNSISTCPYEIERAGGLEEVIRHEITHLSHPKADRMPHEEKENIINNHERTHPQQTQQHEKE